MMIGKTPEKLVVGKWWNQLVKHGKTAGTGSFYTSIIALRERQE